MQVTDNATIENVRDLAEYDSKTSRRILGATVKELRARGVHIVKIVEKLNELGHPWSLELVTADGAVAWRVRITTSNWGKQVLSRRPNPDDDDEDDDASNTSASFL